MEQGLDNDNEGHSGYTADEISSNVKGWLVQNPADVVLLHIGTNDIELGRSVPTIVSEVSSIIDNIHQWNSSVEVILARIILRI